MSESMDVDAEVVLNNCPRHKENTSNKFIVVEDDEVFDLTKTNVATKCINCDCESGEKMLESPEFCLSFYRIKTKLNKKRVICTECYEMAVAHYDNLVQAAIAGFPLTGMDVPFRNDVFAIDSGSESDDEEALEASTMSVLEEHFVDVLSKVLMRHNFNEQVDLCIDDLCKNVTEIEESFDKVRAIYKDVQVEIDKMIFELSNLMRPDIYELLPKDFVVDSVEAIVESTVVKVKEAEKTTPSATPVMSTQNRLKSMLTRSPLKHIQTSSIIPKQSSLVSITQTSANTPKSNITCMTRVIPGVLPPVGEIVKVPLKIGEMYYVSRSKMVGTWIKGSLTSLVGVLMYEVTIQAHQRTIKRVITGKELAYASPANVQLKVGTRVIAAFHESWMMGEIKKDSFYPGIIAEPLQFTNKFRYLVFFDNGYTQYVPHYHVHLIYQSSQDVWEDINVNARAFVKKYLENYENRAMMRFLKDQRVRTEYNGKWLLATIINIDCSLVQVLFNDINRIEWIYRGSTRFASMFDRRQALVNRQHKQRFSSKPNTSVPYVKYTGMDGTVTNSEGQQQQQQRSVGRKSTSKLQNSSNFVQIQEQELLTTEIVQQQQQRSVARKITSKSQNSSNFVQVQEQEPPAMKIVYYTLKRQKPNTCYVHHNCDSACRGFLFCPLSHTKGYSPLAKPLLCGFNRLLYKVKCRKFVMYRAPCGRTLRNMGEVHQYLKLTKSDLTVDLFDFNRFVRCLAEFMVESKSIMVKDLSQGKEECPITVCNYVDTKQLDFCNYSTKRQPMKGVDLNLKPDFLVCCECTDDCEDRDRCACWQLTLQCLKYMEKEVNPATVGYQYRRLPEPIFTGVYECNQCCKCRHSCLNRVVQNPMQHKLQVFKTYSRGWGIRSLNDIPQGSFICIYAGSLLTEEMANFAAKSHGDEYLAELDFIQTAERTKEGYEDDPYSDELDKETWTEDEDAFDADDDEFSSFRKKKNDRDFVPKNAAARAPAFPPNPEMKPPELKKPEVVTPPIEHTVMIDNDEDYAPRHPSSFNPKGEVDDREFHVYKSVRQFFGPDEEVYIIDAKSTGNISRFLNHSCSPNIFVQNVFVDTHDPRFPWVAFFTMCYIRAGTELTWNYNYDIGSVPGKVLYCYCGSSKCKGRLL